MNKIRKVAVLGSGTMGTGIAAHLANAGIASCLLDVVPRELLPAEKDRGLDESSPAFRNRIAENNKAMLLKGKSSGLMDKKDASLITVGNMEDNLDWLGECDWIVEVVTENLAVKKSVLKKIVPFVKPGTIVSSNTSSMSINEIAEDMSPEFRRYWLGTHFFNPVRYMRLLEIIPGRDTLPEVAGAMARFGETVLGKGIVWAKDTPAFVANRLGNYTNHDGLKLAAELGLSMEEVDAVCGSAIGRPATGVFALYDLAGLDIGVASVAEIHRGIQDPEEKKLFAMPGFCYEMMKRGLLGNKTGAGFYKRVGKEKLALDLDTFEYRPLKEVRFDSLDAAKKARTLPEKLTAFFEGDDKAAEFVWKYISRLFLYAAAKIPEVSDNILNLDRGLCWGYNHSKGPFGLWDGLDLEKYINRMEREGGAVPLWVKEMLAAGIRSFYKSEGGRDYYYSIPDKGYLPVPVPEGILSLRNLTESGAVMSGRAGTLWDIGDGVLCLEMKRGAVLTPELLEFIKAAQAELAARWNGMVICSSGANFGSGLDLDALGAKIQQEDWEGIDRFLAQAQAVFRNSKYSAKPVVMAVSGQTKDGACEMAMQSTAVQALAETYMGIAPIAAGLVPSFGGLREIVLKSAARLEGTTASPIDMIGPYFQNMISGAVSGSAKEAKRLGYLRESDGITLNPDLLLSDAKNRVLRLCREGSAAGKSTVPAPGQTALALLKAGVMQMMEAGIASEHDYKVAWKIVDVMAGGQVVRESPITEEYLDSLEREAFLRLCREPKTQERVAQLKKTGKPLRN